MHREAALACDDASCDRGTANSALLAQGLSKTLMPAQQAATRKKPNMQVGFKGL